MVFSEATNVATVAAVSAVMVAILGIVGSFIQNGETRRRNTVEHDNGRMERATAEQRLHERLDSIDGWASHTNGLLVTHVSDPNAHRKGGTT
jgi:hypothetical protein